MGIRALTSDTGGTVLDWRLVSAKSSRASKEQPSFNMDDVHRRTLPETLDHFGLPTFTQANRAALWRDGRLDRSLQPYSAPAL